MVVFGKSSVQGKLQFALDTIHPLKLFVRYKFLSDELPPIASELLLL
jgi:hypothetical protein